MRHVVREIRRLGLDAVLMRYGSVYEYAVEVWGLGPRAAQRLDEFFG